jgi:uncharacterized membrane protein YeaQ/YmgE (transglycosylase-associated protein family)
VRTFSEFYRVFSAITATLADNRVEVGGRTRPRNRHTQAAGRCGRARRSRRLVLQQTKAAGSGATQVTMSIIWTIIIGLAAGVIAKFLYPGNKYEPTGYILTTVLGIIGAFVATYLGQAVGWYQPGESAGFIGAIVGAIIILTVWGFIAPRFERT